MSVCQSVGCSGGSAAGAIKACCELEDAFGHPDGLSRVEQPECDTQTGGEKKKACNNQTLRAEAKAPKQNKTR